MNKKQEFFELIEKNIKKYGYHITFVKGGQNPPFAYTIGLYEKLGFELVVAGDFHSIQMNEKKIRRVLLGLNSGQNTGSFFLSEDKEQVDLELLEMHTTWKELMILGVFDYYKNDDIRAFQIFPVENKSMDIPVMSSQRDKEDPIWCWLDKKWNETIPLSSYVITSVGFLNGENITELMRWEDGYWEMFVGQGSDVPDEDVRILPISTVLGIDDTLRPALKLSIGEGLWRENIESEWEIWK